MNTVTINAHVIVTVDAVDIEQTKLESKDLMLSDEQAAKVAAWHTDAITALDKVCHKTKNNLIQGMARVGSDGRWQIHFMVAES